MHSRMNVGVVVVLALLAVVYPIAVARAQSKGSTELWVRFSGDANKDADDGDSAQLRRAVGGRGPLANTGESARGLMVYAALAISGAALLCAGELRSRKAAWRSAFYKAAFVCCLLVPLTSFLVFSVALADVVEGQPSQEAVETNANEGEERPLNVAQQGEEKNSSIPNQGEEGKGEEASSDVPSSALNGDEGMLDDEDKGTVESHNEDPKPNQDEQKVTSTNETSSVTEPDPVPKANVQDADAPDEVDEALLDVGELDFSSARLLVGMAARPEVGEVLSSCKNVWLVQFATQEDAIAAYKKLLPIAEFVVPDQVMMIVGGSARAEVGPVANLAALNDTEQFREDVVVLVDTGVLEYTTNAIVRLSVIGTSVDDDNGHGTHVVRALTAFDPSMHIVSIKAADAHGQATVASIYVAIHKAIDMNAKVVSLPWHTKANEGNAVVEQAICDAHAAGVMVVTAAGDDASDVTGYFPGNMGDEAVVVGLCDTGGVRTPSSNYGETVDLYVPAESTSIAVARVSAWLCGNGQFGHELQSLSSAEARHALGFDDSQNVDAQKERMTEAQLEEPVDDMVRQQKGLSATEQPLAAKGDAKSGATRGEDEAQGESLQIRMTVPVGIHYVVQSDGVAVGPSDGSARICNEGETPVRIKEATARVFEPYEGELGFSLSDWRVEPGDSVDLLDLRGTMVSQVPVERQVGSIRWTFEVDG